MRWILSILIFISLSTEAQVIRANAFYRPFAGVSNLLLDDYSGATVAYSLRKLDKDYSGSAIRVRESGSNTEQDIGFLSSGELDTTSLKSFCGSNSGFVVTWYDQSGNTNNATQSTAANQPRIVSAGVVERTGGKVAINWVDGSDNLAFTKTTNNRSIFYLLQLRTSAVALFNTHLLGDNTNYDYHVGYGGSSPYSWLSSSDAAAVVRNGSNYINGVSRTLTTYTRDGNRNLITMLHTASSGVSSRISQDRAFTDRSWQGFIQELIIYPTDQTSNRTSIESNINTWWGVY